MIQVICKDLAAGHAEIGAAGRLMTPGGIDGHCYLGQPMTDGSKMTDEFYLVHDLLPLVAQR